ncbi:glutaredoxin-like domain protein [Thermobaculum terrenum ATCC BAA-798]|uniref:Glutaredoxin-like domain protein n=1 Tax=Thermobaculum terrenum (strain ATCC BAA-798 / CCMEE 7001 / YNP1) TaxID=525904 RepID=D1CGT2_THET1|nr:thioredoxin family protein [Thermobaculum terrenum]ACZ42953.1 glutaredoxin-like domain protein [Thermobaculum terrenum ATCC BAA-798]
MVSSVVRDKMKQILEDRLADEVKLVLFSQKELPIYVPGRECPQCPVARKVLEELVGMSPKLQLEFHDIYSEGDLARERGVERIPTIEIEGRNRGRMRFLGAPAGHELSALLDAISDASTGSTSLGNDTKQWLQELGSSLHIRVFSTPTCPYCPQMARLAWQLAVESPQVTAEVVDATAFPDLAQRYMVYGVPKTIVNDRLSLEGAMAEADLVAQLRTLLVPPSEDRRGTE